MKLYHLIIVFAIIVLSFIISADAKTNDFIAVVKNKEQIDKNLQNAIDDGVTRLVQVDSNNNLVINKDAAIDSFFISLHSSFGVLSDKDNEEKLNLYIPTIVVTVEDGYYVFYSDEFTGADNHKYISKRWSEKYPFYYEDEDFIYGFTLGDVVSLYDKNHILDPSGEQEVFTLDYHTLRTDAAYTGFCNSRQDSILLSDDAFEQVRKDTMIQNLENSLAYYTSRHNQIAEQYGFTYNFSLPQVEDDQWAPYLNDASMFVVFQGYPYGSGTGEVYSRFASAGAKVSKNNLYYIEQKDWYLVYHKSNCPELRKEGILLLGDPVYSIETAAKQGCYACKICSPDGGAYAPNYIPILGD